MGFKIICRRNIIGAVCVFLIGFVIGYGYVILSHTTTRADYIKTSNQDKQAEQMLKGSSYIDTDEELED